MTTENRPFLAALWMLGAIASFTLMAVAGRAVQTEMTSFELMAWRSAIGFLLVCAILTRAGFAQIRSAQTRLHVLRNLFHFAGQNLWFSALPLIPLAQVFALEFTGPVWVALLAPFLLGERFTPRKGLAVALGFSGVLLVVRPDAAAIGWGHAAGLGAALCFALNTIFTRKLLGRDTVLGVLFWMTLSQSLMGFAISLPLGLHLPSQATLPWLIALGITGLTAHYSLSSALGHAPASVVAPMEFARLPVIAVVGALFYDEPLVMGIFTGGAVILAANLVNFSGLRPRRETAS